VSGEQQDGAVERIEALLKREPGIFSRQEEADFRAVLAERDALAARVAELCDEWGVQSADSGRAQVCDDEDQARYLAERYSRFRLPGGDPVRHHVVRRLATGWRDAEAADAAPDGRSATETP